MKRNYFLLFGIFLLLCNDVNAATTVDDGSFGTIWDALVAWMQGSLGYIIALLGMIGFMLWYMLHSRSGFEPKLTVLFVGMLFSMLVGGAVGIVQTMFGLGAGTFN